MINNEFKWNNFAAQTRTIYIQRSNLKKSTKKYLRPVFRIRKNELEFSTSIQKFKWLFCTKKMFFNVGIYDF